MKRLLLIILSCLVLSSCSVLSTSSTGFQVKYPSGTRYLDVKILQTLSKHSALAYLKGQYGNYYGDLIKIVTEKDMYYDDLIVQGYFVLVSTYSYTTNAGYQKTVPVYIKLSEYREIVSANRDIAKVVDYLNY